VVRDSAWAAPPGAQEDAPASTPDAVSYELSGPLSSPQLTRISSSPHRAR
jgi:hypothetical protein